MSHGLKIHNKIFINSFPSVFIFLLTACNKIKTHRGNEIKEIQNI